MSPRTPGINLKRMLITIAACQAGFMLCYQFVQLGLNPILASCSCGLVASYIPKSKFYCENDVRASIYCASFAAIGTHLSCNTAFEFLLIPFVLGLLFHWGRNLFIGYGGKLGTLAFISTTIYMAIMGTLL